MKMFVLAEVDVSKTLAETMQRTGFSLVPDGGGFQVLVPNSPPITRRKVKVAFVRNPPCDLKSVVDQLVQVDSK